MGSNFFKHRLSDLLSSAGITVNGSAPWDITVHDDRFYRRVLSGSHLGAGESYMDGWWDAPAFDEFFYRTIKAWHSNIEDNRAALSLTYDERFHRMWRILSAQCRRLLQGTPCAVMATALFKKRN